MSQTNKQKTISMIGGGSWGTAIAVIMAENNPDYQVKIWAYEKSVVNSIRNRRENMQYLPGVLIPKNVSVSNSIREVSQDSNIIILNTPSKVVPDICQRLSKYVSEYTIFSVMTKGFCKVNSKVLTISQTVENTIPKLKGKVLAIYGPSHAEEVINRYHTCLNIAGSVGYSRKIISKLLSNDYLQCRETEDILGVEVGGTLKNPAAIAAGMISVMPKCGDNLSGALISEALKEMLRLGRIFDAKDETIVDISGLGDLVATALSEHSRNRRFGIEISNQIIKNKKKLDIFDKLVLRFRPEDIIEKLSKKVNYLAEGAFAIEPLIELAEQHNIPIPVYKSLHEVLLNKKDPALLIETIKNPEKFEQLYSETKILISDRKKGLERVKGHVYNRIITDRIVDKFSEKKKMNGVFNHTIEGTLSHLDEFEKDFTEIKNRKLKKAEAKILDTINEENFEKSIKSLAKIYSSSITDNFNTYINWFFLKYIQIGNFFKTLFRTKGSFVITGMVDKIKNIGKSVNIIYLPTFRNLHDFLTVLYAINKMRLPFPRFFVSREVYNSTRNKLLLKLAGGFVVDPDRLSNPIYKETLCEYISILGEHGVPVLYFPQQRPDPKSKVTSMPDDFFEIILEAIYQHTVEIVLVPIEISYIDKPDTETGEDFSLLKFMKNSVNMNFSAPVCVSEYTMQKNPVQKIKKVIKKIWNDDAVDNPMEIRIKSDEELL
jgi:glycerol-3-phosphate dehydrogenase